MSIWWEPKLPTQFNGEVIEDAEQKEDHIRMSVTDLIEENQQLRLLYRDASSAISLVPLSITKDRATSMRSIDRIPEEEEAETQEAEQEDSDNALKKGGEGIDVRLTSEDRSSTGIDIDAEETLESSPNTKWRARARDLDIALNCTEQKLRIERSKRRILLKKIQEREENIAVQSTAAKLVDKQLRASEQEVLQLRAQLLSSIPTQMQLVQALGREQKSESACRSTLSRLEEKERALLFELSITEKKDMYIAQLQEQSTQVNENLQDSERMVCELRRELARSETAGERALVCVALAEDKAKKSENKRIQSIEENKLLRRQMSAMEYEIARLRRQWAEHERKMHQDEVEGCSQMKLLCQLKEKENKICQLEQKLGIPSKYTCVNAHINSSSNNGSDSGSGSTSGWGLGGLISSCLPVSGRERISYGSLNKEKEDSRE